MMQIHIGKDIIDGSIRDWQIFSLFFTIINTFIMTEFLLHLCQHRFRPVNSDYLQAFSNKTFGDKTGTFSDICSYLASSNSVHGERFIPNRL